MKKLIYISIIAMVASLAMTSCTEEEVKPSTVMNGGGGGMNDNK